MLWSSKQVGDMGADNTYGQYLKGWSEFSKGETKEFPGVNLIDEKLLLLLLQQISYHTSLN